MKKSKGNTWTYTAILMLLGIVSILLVGTFGKQDAPYTFDSAADIDIDLAAESYEADGSNDALYRLLLGMCRRMATEDVDQAFTDRFCELGTELYDRAKEESLDLNKIGDPDVTLHMLDLLNQNGVNAR